MDLRIGDELIEPLGLIAHKMVYVGPLGLNGEDVLTMLSARENLPRHPSRTGATVAKIKPYQEFPNIPRRFDLRCVCVAASALRNCCQRRSVPIGM